LAVAQLVAVVAAVGDDGGGLRRCFETRLGGHIIADIARGRNQDDGAAFIVVTA
jgi:hypothetical protein